ncbi:MAG: pre-peptidase C-terminal domain-containing protein [archaeon]|nr:pre-peptidase C-terminal domain-containing protein [archaeon]MCP8320632.1 pre-peptidase C-terminal domain-containing protein [archaeon]
MSYMQDRIGAKSYKRVLSTSILMIFAISLLIFPVRPALGNSEVTVFSEGFEGVFPTDNGWEVGDVDNMYGDDYWGATDYRYHSGSKSGWCAQIGKKMTGSASLLLDEDWESGSDGWSFGDSNPVPPDAYWDLVTAGFGGEGTYSGSYKVYCSIPYDIGPQYKTNIDSYMTTTVDITGNQVFWLLFMYKMPSLGTGDYGQLLVDDTELERFETVQTDWTLASVWFDYDGTTVDLTWNFHSDSSGVAEGWYIDDIIMYGVVGEDNSVLHEYDYAMDSYMMKQINLTDYESATLSHWYWLDSETDYDYLYVMTSTDGSIWNVEESYTGDSAGWVQDTVDLTSYVGSSVYIKYTFYSTTFSDKEGAYLDDILITAVPQDDAGSGGDAGDDFDTATQISAGSYEGFVEDFDINDYYKIHVSAGNTINVTMTPSGGSNFDLKLFDPNEDLVEESTNSGSAEESISYTAETSGDHFILVYYVSGSSTYELEIEIEDNIPPTLSITSPTNGTEVKSSSVSVTWTGSDADSGIDHYEVRLDDGSWSGVGTALTYTFVNVPDGSHTIRVKAVDVADNSKIALVNITVNTSLLLGPGWMDDILIFAVIIIAIVVIAGGIVIVKRRKPPLPPPPPRY